MFRRAPGLLKETIDFWHLCKVAGRLRLPPTDMPHLVAGVAGREEAEAVLG